MYDQRRRGTSQRRRQTSGDCALVRRQLPQLPRLLHALRQSGIAYHFRLRHNYVYIYTAYLHVLGSAFASICH